LIDYQLKQLLLLAKYDHRGVYKATIIADCTSSDTSDTIFIYYALADALENGLVENQTALVTEAEKKTGDDHVYLKTD